MTDETQAKIRAKAAQFEEMISKMSMSGELEHSELYLNILGDRVEILQSSPGEVILSYGTFDSDYFDEIELQKDVSKEQIEDSQGNKYSYEVGAEAILDVERTIEYLGYASGGGVVELTFSGREDRRLSMMLRAEGALETWVNLPSQGNIVDEIPHWIPFRYNDDNDFISPAGDPAPTQIQTQVSELSTIVEVVNSNPDTDFYPLVVEDSNLRIDVGEEKRTGVQGILSSQSVKGPDVENYYFDGFEEILNVLDGPIELQTAPGNSPLSVVCDTSNGSVVRHVNGTVNV